MAEVGNNSVQASRENGKIVIHIEGVFKSVQEVKDAVNTALDVMDIFSNHNPELVGAE